MRANDPEEIIETKKFALEESAKKEDQKSRKTAIMGGEEEKRSQRNK